MTIYKDELDKIKKQTLNWDMGNEKTLNFEVHSADENDDNSYYINYSDKTKKMGLSDDDETQISDKLSDPEKFITDLNAQILKKTTNRFKKIHSHFKKNKIHPLELEKEIKTILDLQSFEEDNIWFDDQYTGEYDEKIATSDDIMKTFNSGDFDNAVAEIITNGLIAYLDSTDDPNFDDVKRSTAPGKKNVNKKGLLSHYIEIAADEYGTSMDIDSNEEYAISEQLSGELGRDIGYNGAKAIATSLIDTQDALDHIILNLPEKSLNTGLVNMIGKSIKDMNKDDMKTLFDNRNHRLEQLTQNIC
jgi:hypothetical protein